MHNFFLPRSDGTTAAARCFGQKPRSMFAAILAFVARPPAPLRPPQRATGEDKEDRVAGAMIEARIHCVRKAMPLAMTMLAVPSCVPISTPQQAFAYARALSTITSCQPHCNSSQPFAPVFAAAGLSLLPAWGTARLAGGQPGGLPSSQHWHAGAAERHAPWGHVKSGLFSLYSRTSYAELCAHRLRCHGSDDVGVV